MKIAIQNKSTGFHPYWIEYCKKNNIPYKLVDCYQNDIIKQLEGCDALMWHHAQTNIKDVLFAKQLLSSLQQAGKVVFPDFNTAWHFDDKVGQKYLLEALNIPLVDTFVFYDKQSAMEWVSKATFPKVFKLRGGAGASNVSLAKTKSEARRLIKQAFGNGFSQYPKISNLKERIRKYGKGIGSLKDVGKGIIRLAYPPQFAKVMGKDVGYIYFQEFIPENDSDIRVIVIDNKAFAIKRMTRENDFRASGSGMVLYEKEYFSDEIINLSFEINEKLQSQSLAIDYVLDKGKPKIVEISYGFIKKVYDDCVGYWDKELNFYPEKIDPMGWMVETVIKQIKANQIQI